MSDRRVAVADFDGTIARLDIDWQALRRVLGVTHIGDLWERDDPSGWNLVTQAEVEAAHVARSIEATAAELEACGAVAILTSNAEAAVTTFLDQSPALASRVMAVVGRETLGGPKTDFDVFSRGFSHCVAALGAFTDLIYIGDQAYELDFARRLGVVAYDVTELP